MDVRAWRPAALANRDDLFDFGERKPEAACLLHEVQHADSVAIVEAVPIRGALGWRQNALALIEADRLRRYSSPTSQFTDFETAIHDTLIVNLSPKGKVKRLMVAGPSRAFRHILSAPKMNLPRFGGHSRSHGSAVGVWHGQTQAAGGHDGGQG